MIAISNLFKQLLKLYEVNSFWSNIDPHFCANLIQYPIYFRPGYWVWARTCRPFRWFFLSLAFMLDIAFRLLPNTFSVRWQ